VHVLSVLHPLLLLLKVAVLFLSDSQLFLGVLDLFDLPLNLGEGTGVEVGVGPRLLVLELDGVVLFEKHIDGDVQGPQGGAQVLVHFLEVDVLVLKSKCDIDYLQDMLVALLEFREVETVVEVESLDPLLRG